jgi:hypothetical protein
MPPICLPDSRLATLMRLPSRYSRSAATRPFACFRMSRVPSVEHSGVFTLCATGGTQGPSSYILSYSY